MLLLHTLLPLLVSLFAPELATLQLQKDLEKDYRLLTQGQYFISDNTTASPSLQTIENDLALFQILAHLDLSSTEYNTGTSGNHEIKKWGFKEGDMTALYQIDTTIRLDTAVAVRYLDNKPPTQQQLQNTFHFRTYVVATTTAPDKFLYVTEAHQGLITYRIDIRQVDLVYSRQKEGLSVVLPGFLNEINQLVPRLQEEVR